MCGLPSAQPPCLLFAQKLSPSTDNERYRFIKLFRAAQKAQETGTDTGYEFHTKPRYVLAVDAVQGITLGVKNSKSVEARSIHSTICANWRFLDRSNKIVESKICDGVGKLIPSRQWSCYLHETPKTQQGKIKHLLKCAPEMCFNQKEIKALIPETADSRGQLEALWKRGDVVTDTLDKQVITLDGKRLSAEQLTKIPPALWNIELRKRKVSPAALRRHRSLKRTFLPKSTLTCFRAPRR